MRILLDENFPIPLHRELRKWGYDAEHIIVLGQRGLPDERIRRRLEKEELLFLTQDKEFAELAADSRSTVILSRVDQSLPIATRVRVWLAAIEAVLATRPGAGVFELAADGRVVSVQPRRRE